MANYNPTTAPAAKEGQEEQAKFEHNFGEELAVTEFVTERHTVVNRLRRVSADGPEVLEDVSSVQVARSGADLNTVWAYIRNTDFQEGDVYTVGFTVSTNSGRSYTHTFDPLQVQA